MRQSIAFILVLFLLLNVLHAQTEEKRLALVIGNANYDKGALDNPVNDALLMAATLDSLGFDVILDTNITTIDQFKKTVRSFGDQRAAYNVGLTIMQDMVCKLMVKIIC